MNIPKQKDSILAGKGEKGEPKAHHLTATGNSSRLISPNPPKPSTNLTSSNQTQTNPSSNPSSTSYTYPYLLTMSDKDRQMVASNWLLNKELRAKLEIKQVELPIKEFRSLISKETGLVYWGVKGYFITWLDSLEGTGDYVRLSFRSSELKGECLNYCVVKSSNK